INSLRHKAEENIKLRQSEIHKCEVIINKRMNDFEILRRERNIELAFGEIPKKVKEIKDIAISEVFAKDINDLDSKGKEVLDKVLVYMEKKYNAVAMKTAKEVFLKNE
ncbi:MAG: glutamyl-tRNA reductase, partial [Bacteroidia bacterium]